MLRKLIRRVRRFNKAFLAHQLKCNRDAGRERLVVRVQNYPMEFTINIATNANYGSPEVYHQASERLCFNEKDEYSTIRLINTVFEL